MNHRTREEQLVTQWLQQAPVFSSWNVPLPSQTTPSLESWVAAGKRIQHAPSILSGLLLRNDTNAVLSDVAFALGWIGNTDNVPVLVAALKHSDPEVRKHAAVALGRLGAKSATNALCQTLQKDRDETVRANAAMALGSLKDAAAVPFLTNAVHDTDSFVREVSQKALEAILR